MRCFAFSLPLSRLAVSLLAVLLTVSAAPADEAVTVFAAASLKDAMTAIADRYKETHTSGVRFSFAASSTLARQIEAGAPAHIFASANTRWADRIETQGFAEPGFRRELVGNRLVLVAPFIPPADAHDVPASGQIRELKDRRDLTAWLGPGDILVMGDPYHVPAGFYARQALENLGVWDDLAGRIARASDVRAALALVARGEAPLGIVYATDARISDRVKVIGHFPESSHDAIRYPFIILNGRATPAARAFFDFLTGPDGLDIFGDFGFCFLERETNPCSPMRNSPPSP